MRVLLQRVSQAQVTVEAQPTGQIDSGGLLLFVGFREGDRREVLPVAAEKISALRVFQEGEKQFQLSVLDTQGSCLVVPQFTLYADTKKGRRPDFTEAMKPALANELFEEFLQALRHTGVQQVERGKFGAHMMVSLVNDGPVTIMLEF